MEASAREVGACGISALADKDLPLESVRDLQRRLYSSAKENPARSYGILYDKVCRQDILREAWRRVARKGGCAGVDARSIPWIREYGVEKYLEELREKLLAKEYHAEAVLRVYLRKPDGGQRPLGIPTVTDRVVQMAVKLVMEPLFEADFSESSYGFRPQRSAHEAIGEIDGWLRRGYGWVVDVDLEKCFDTIPHEALMERVRRRVRDPRVLRLIRKWLKAGIMEGGEMREATRGTPQGGVLSPLLANIYLHEVDQRWQERAPRARMLRYADDLLILCRTEADARREHAELQAVLQRMGIRLNANKTRVVAVREGFDFLGFSYRVGHYERDGKQREIMIKVPRARALKALQARLKEVVQGLPLGAIVVEAVKAVSVRLRGWANYFRVANMQAAIKRLVWHATRQLRLFLRRKYQRKRCQHGRRWPDSYFHAHLGLCTTTQLLTGR